MPQIKQGNKLPSATSRGGRGTRGAKSDFLQFLSFSDTSFHIDDFLGDTIDLDYYALAKTAVGGEANFATLIAQGSGYVQGDTGGTSGNAISLVGPITFRPANNAGMWIRFRLNDVTNVNFEVGFIDAVPASNAGGVTDVDTPTAVAANLAVLAMDTSQTLTTMAFVTKGSASNQTIKATTLTGITTPVNTTFMDVAIQLTAAGEAVCTVNDGQAVVYNVADGGNNIGGTINKAVSLAPWVYLRTRTAGSRTMDIDAIATWTDRIA